MTLPNVAPPPGPGGPDGGWEQPVRDGRAVGARTDQPGFARAGAVGNGFPAHATRLAAPAGRGAAPAGAPREELAVPRPVTALPAGPPPGSGPAPVAKTPRAATRSRPLPRVAGAPGSTAVRPGEAA